MTESELNEANPDAYDSFGVIQTGLLIKQQQTWRKLGEEKKKTKEKRLLIAGTAVLDPTIRRSCVECVMRFRRRLERSTSKSGRCVRSHGVVYLASMIGVEKKWTVPGSSSGSLPLPLPLSLSFSVFATHFHRRRICMETCRNIFWRAVVCVITIPILKHGRVGESIIWLARN